MYYFAYGSNMSAKRLNNRIKAAKFANGKLLGHTLKFHKISSDGSGKCDAFETKNLDDYVLGVIYEIDKDDLEQLDRFEAKSKGYERKEVEIILENMSKISAITYYATNINYTLSPYDWYKYHVLHGAIENKFDETYIKFIESISSISDPDTKRNTKELEIYK